MKFKRVIEKILRKEMHVSEDQFGLMLVKCGSYFLRRLMETYQERKRDVRVVFIHLNKVSDRRRGKEIYMWFSFIFGKSF